MEKLTPEAPLGFATLDVDYYSSSKPALALFTGKSDCYLPLVPIYVDDVNFPQHNSYCGEQLAIAEFNDAGRFFRGGDQGSPVVLRRRRGRDRDFGLIRTAPPSNDRDRP